MNFLNPLVLFGLAAAAVPFIIHLLNLRKHKEVEFSTLRFLKELQKTKIRRLKIKQWILLALRTLLIIFAVLAFARPTVDAYLPGLGSSANTSAFIIVDNSFSMDVSDERGLRLNRAKNAAIDIIGNLREGDEAIVVPLSDIGGLEAREFSRNLEELTDEVRKIQISEATEPLEGKLRIASAAIENAKNMQKEIYVISDAQSCVFARDYDDSLDLFGDESQIYFLPIGAGSRAEIKNLSIDSINVITRIYQIGRLVETEAVIKNRSDENVENAALSMFFNDERVAGRAANAQTGLATQIAVSSEAQDFGFNRARLELESDALSYDNERFFGFVIPEKPSVLIVGTRETSKFVSILFRNEAEIESPAVAQTIDPAAFGSKDLLNFDVVILTEELRSSSDYDRLEAYVRGGGAVIFYADPDSETLRSGIEKFGFSGMNRVEFDPENPAVFTSVDKMHPIFEGVFIGDTDPKKIVDSPKIYAAAPVESGRAIIEMPGGAFLSESPLGDGKTLYCAVPPNFESGNFALSGIFPVIVFRGTVYLSFREQLGMSVNVGDVAVADLPARYGENSDFKITDPNGLEYFVKSTGFPGGAKLRLTGLDERGVYTIEDANDRKIGVVSVNSDPRESDLAALSDKRIEQALRPIVGAKARIKFLEDDGAIASEVERARLGSELWQLFVILSLACAAAEMLIARSSKKDLAK